MALATPPVRINFCGNIESRGKPPPTGCFYFAIVNQAQTQTYWSNDGSSSAGGRPEHCTEVEIGSQGEFCVLLGDTDLPSMTGISPSIFDSDDTRFLSLWFRDITADLPAEQLTPNTPLTYAPFSVASALSRGTDALTASAVTSTGSVSVSSGNVTIASGNFVAQSGNVTVSGSVTGSSGAFTGLLSAGSASITGAMTTNSLTTGLFSAGTTTLTGTLSGTSARFSNDLSAQSATFSQGMSAASATLTGALSASSASISGNTTTGTLSAGATTLTGALSGTSASFSSGLAGTSAAFSSSLSAASGVFSGDLTVDSDSLVVDSVNDRVGIGVGAPAVGFDVAKNMRVRTTATTGTGVLIDCSSISSGVCLDLDAQSSLASSGNALRIKFDSTLGAQNIFLIRDVAGSGTNVFAVSGTGAISFGNAVTSSAAISTSSNISTTGSGTITSANGLTVSSGTVTLPSNSIESSEITDGTIVNADVNASAAIAYSKLNLSGSLVNADVSNSAAIAYSKLNLASSIVSSDITDGTIANADVNASAAIAYSKLNLNNSLVAGDLTTGSVTSAKILDGTIATADIASGAVTTTEILDGTILNADVSATAAIAYSKLALTNSLVASDLTTGSVTSAKILDGEIVNADVNASAAIAYSKLNLASSVTSSDITDATIVAADISTGAVTSAKILDGTLVIGDIDTTATLAADPALSANLYTFGTTGLIFEGATADAFEGLLIVADPTADRTWTLPNVSGTLLTSGDTGTVTSANIADDSIVNADVNSNAAIAYSKLNLASSIVNADVSNTAAIAYSKLNLTNSLVAGDLTTGAVTGAKILDNTIDFVDLADSPTLDANFSVNQSTYTWTQNFTGTTGTADTRTAASLTTGKLFDWSATNTSTSATAAVNPVTLALTNAQATNAQTSGSYTGVNMSYVHNPTAATTNESMLRIGLEQNDANITDTTISSLLKLENLDTATGSALKVSDGILIQATTNTYITDAIDVSDAEIDNAINIGANPIVTGGGAGTLGDATTTSWTLTTDGTGDGEVTLPAQSVSSTEMTNSGATAGTYGSATQSPQIVVDAAGRITSVSNVTVTGTVPGGAAGGDLTGTYPNPTIAANAVTSAKILDGEIVNADVNASAAIAYAKLALSNSIVAGDITTGAVTSAKILDGEIVNADVSTTAAIAYSKLALTNSIVAGDLTTGSVTSAKILDGEIVNADVNASAAIAYSKLNLSNSIVAGDITTGAVTSAKILDGEIVNADVNASAAIAYSKLNLASSLVPGDFAVTTLAGDPALTAGQVQVDSADAQGGLLFEGATANGFETLLTVAEPTADRTLTLPNVTGTIVTTGDTSSVTSAMITDGEIVNADVNASAAIAYSKLNLSNSIVAGDLTTGAVTSAKILDGEIVNADVNASAAIAYSKLNLASSLVPGDFAATTLAGNPALTAGQVQIDTADSQGGILFEGATANTSEGLLTVAEPTADRTWTLPNVTGTIITTGDTDTVTTTMISDGTIANADVSSSAAIAYSKLNLSNSIVAGDITTGAVTSAKILDGDIVNADINSSAAIAYSKLSLGSSIVTGDITDNTLTTSDLAATLTFADGDYLDLSAILHDDTAVQGLRLPNVGAAPVDPTGTGEGYIAWDETDNLLLVNDGTIWQSQGMFGATIDSSEITDGAIVNADVNASAAIAYSKLNLSNSIVAGDITTGAVTSAKILDGEIVNADVNASAAIAYSKLALSNSIVTGDITDNTLTTSDLAATLTFADGDYLDLSAILHDDSAVQGLRLPNVGAAPTDPTGTGEGYIAWDETDNLLLVNDGTTWQSQGMFGATIDSSEITDGAIVNADVNASAAIAYSKLNLSNSLVAGDITTGAVTSAKILDGEIVNGDISNSAAIAYSKLNLSTSIVNADVSSSAAIAYAKLNLSSSLVPGDFAAATLAGNPALTAGQIQIDTADSQGGILFEGATANTSEGLLTVAEPTADRTWTLPNVTGTIITTGDTDTVTSTMVKDGDLVNADINASAAIAYSKLNLTASLIGSDLASNIAITSTGAQDFSGASSVKIPAGAAPTVDAAGKIAIDTTDDQLAYYGGAKRVIPYRQTKCTTIENLGAADDHVPMFIFNKDATIVQTSCYTTSTTIPDYTLEDNSNNAVTGAGTCVNSGTATWTNTTSGNTFSAGETVRINTGTAADASTWTTICIAYTEDAQ